MEHAVTQYDIELLWPQRKSKQVHLREPDAVQLMLRPKSLSKTQGVQAQIDPDNPATGNTQEVTELAGSATDLQHRRVVRYRPLQRAPVQP